MQKLVILFDYFEITIVQAILFTISALQHERKKFEVLCVVEQ
jgi:hypothetical protein